MFWNTLVDKTINMANMFWNLLVEKDTNPI